MPEPSALTSETEPWRSASARPGVPICDCGLSSSGSAKAASRRRHSTLTGFRPDDGAHHQPAVRDGQVLAFEQHDAEIAGDVGVLEVGLVERAGRQDGDAAVGAGDHAVQGVAEAAEEAGEPVDVHLAIDVGQRARGGDAVLQREAGARRRLGAVAEHPPVAVGAAAELEGAEMQEVPARPASRRPSAAGIPGCEAIRPGGSRPSATRRLSP